MKKIPLPSRRFAIVDDDDYEYLLGFKWHVINGYACHRKKLVTTPMHRIVLERKTGKTLEKGEFPDHINGIRLDNRKSNLRVATVVQNGQNRRKLFKTSSKFKGVSWVEDHKSWCVRIKHNGKNTFVGYFKDETSAAKAYDKEAVRLYGEFARTNKNEGLL